MSGNISMNNLFNLQHSSYKSEWKLDHMSRHLLFSSPARWMINSVDCDQLASEKPADLDIQCFPKGYIWGQHGRGQKYSNIALVLQDE